MGIDKACTGTLDGGNHIAFRLSYAIAKFAPVTTHRMESCYVPAPVAVTGMLPASNKEG